MFGLPQHLGHLTASGTIANLEALWVARELHPDRAIVSGANAHYTHARVSAVLGARHETVPRGRARPDRPRRARGAAARAAASARSWRRRARPALGAVDDVAAIADLCAEHGARLHVDAAYGGFFALLADGGEPGVAAAPFAAIARADSVVVDPHKHGLQPYGCGCVLFADPGVGRLYAHDSPYTYFTSDELHLGEISLECSRAGRGRRRAVDDAARAPARPARASAATSPPRARRPRRRCRGARRDDPRTALVLEPEIDIVCALPAGASAAAIDRRRRARVRHARRRRAGTSRSCASRTDWLRRTPPGASRRTPPDATVLRCCLLKQRARRRRGRARGRARRPPRRREGPRMKRPFRQVDVFSRTPYAGNPVAVVLDAQDLSTEEMQRFAHWTNLSETTFVLPPRDPAADYRVRIFTPVAELPFAGHPTLGTCHAWAELTGSDADRFTQECDAGLITVRRTDAGLAFAAPPLRREGPVEDALAARVAATLGLERGAIADLAWADNGPGWIAVLLDSADAVLALEPAFDDLDVGVAGPHPAGGEVAWEVRAFFPKDGAMVEDPVTGSLNASLAMWLLGSGRATAPVRRAPGDRARPRRPRARDAGRGRDDLGRRRHASRASPARSSSSPRPRARARRRGSA